MRLRGMSCTGKPDPKKLAMSSESEVYTSSCKVVRVQTEAQISLQIFLRSRCQRIGAGILIFAQLLITFGIRLE
jgi:hypothetical protein